MKVFWILKQENFDYIYCKNNIIDIIYMFYIKYNNILMIYEIIDIKNIIIVFMIL